MAWHLAQLKPNAHQLALRNLNRQGFETFLPLARTTARRGSRFVKREQPLFPGYLFVWVGESGGHFRAINSTLGVSRLVSLGNAPARVPDELVEQLRTRCDDRGIFHAPPELSEGDRVRVQAGPFARFMAKVEKMDADRRVWVLLEIMGSPTRINLPQDSIAKTA